MGSARCGRCWVSVLRRRCAQVYAVATSVSNACTRIPRMTGEEKEFESIERGQCAASAAAPCWTLTDTAGLTAPCCPLLDTD